MSMPLVYKVPTLSSQSRYNFGGCYESECREGQSTPGPSVAALEGSIGKHLAADSPLSLSSLLFEVTDGEGGLRFITAISLASHSCLEAITVVKACVNHGLAP